MPRIPTTNLERTSKNVPRIVDSIDLPFCRHSAWITIMKADTETELNPADADVDKNPPALVGGFLLVRNLKN